MTRATFGAQPENQELVRWVAECVDGTASEETWRRLDALLKTDAAARHYYVAHLHLHATLMRKLPAPEIALPDVDRALAPDRDSSPGEPAKPRSRWVVLRDQVHAGVRQLARPTPIAVFVAAASLLLLLVAFAAIPVSFEAVDRPRPTSPPDRQTFVAELVETSRPQWSGKRSYIAGDRLHVGQILELRTGMAAIRFDRGAQVVLEGPAKLRVTSNNAAHLAHGRLTANVPPRAVGYAVSVKQMTITDLGTQFGVVAGQGATQVHVFRGRVAVGPADGSAAEPHILLAGAAAEFNDRGQPAGDYVAADDTFRHADALTGADEVRVRGNLRYLISPPQSLAAGGPLENNHVAHLLLERSDVTLTDDIPAQIVAADSGDEARLRPGRIASGTRVCSYLIHFDIEPVEGGKIIQRTGLIEFSRPILAVIFNDDQLAATDATLGVEGAVYDTETESRTSRGFEPGEFDKLSISADRRTLRITCGLGSASTDQVRVILPTEKP